MRSIGAEQACGARFVAGDVVEIQTEGGLAYVQVTHLHDAYPEVIRILPGLHATACDSAELLIQLPTCFRAITPLAAAIFNGQLGGRHVGHYPVPKADQVFPDFRMPVRDRRGELLYWWLWDGDGLRYVECGATIDDLPIREVVPPDTLQMRLVERLSPKAA